MADTIIEPAAGTGYAFADAGNGAYLDHRVSLLSRVESARLVEEISAAKFEQGWIQAADRAIPTPRLCAAYGDRTFAYPDMGPAADWPPQLRALRDRLAALAKHPFNYALLNLYRDGQDFTGWHADKMHLHEPDTEVAIVSLGATRSLHLRRTDTQAEVAVLPLADGSLLRMLGTLHDHYEHCVPMVPGLRARRLSITFRQVADPAAGR